ncbi:MAG: BBP7 family outer membrane beta-barrel protein [Planctomycetia bacterium]|nr:BBP7 family outer membrane beta-barrel protein [Planctomycetia bacterium]
MTRARCYALALLVGVCCMGPAQAFAQYGPAPRPGYGPGGPDCPIESSDPMTAAPWYGTGDDGVEPSINRFGPQARINSWFLRAEYLHWNIDSPGNVMLGAPVQDVSDPTQPFEIFAVNNTTPIAFGAVPTTKDIRLNDTSGIQVTGGVELIDGGRIEISAFMLGRKQSGITLPLGAQVDTALLPGGSGIAGAGPFVPLVAVTSTLTNGQIGDNLLLYNVSYKAVMTSQLWGGEINYLADQDATEIWQFLPLGGFRYLNLTERFTQYGLFDDQFVTSPPINTQIESLAINNLWGGQIGFRGQFVSKYLEFGATPKVLFLGDSAVSSVYAARLRSSADPTVSSTDMTTKFTFGGDLNGFVNINLSPSFSIRGGYTILWINQVTRPHRDIVYDDHGPAAPAGIGQQFVFHDIFIHGFNFGCEFRF